MYIFGGLQYSVLGTPFFLYASSILDFRGMSGIEPRVLMYQAGAPIT
jgi:hypothetical protein